jgi:hypothetical protein
MTQFTNTTTRRPAASRLRGALLGALLAGALCADALPTHPVAAQDALPGGNPGQVTPRDDDFDIDGLLNDDEAIHGTDPANWDTDGDGGGDGAEIENGTNPLVPEEHVFTPPVDTDEDGIPDLEETELWITDPNDYDSDEDRIGDGWEAYHYETDPTWDDTDRDGLSDSEELFTHTTDPLTIDTDGDGYPDGQEVHGACPGDPLDPAKGPRFMC